MILHFSGTGNSRYIAELIAQNTGDQLFSLNDAIKENASPQLAAGEPLIFVVPTYAWRVPLVVEDWITSHIPSTDNPAWFVLTCGDSIGDAPKYARQLCDRQGFTYMGMAGLVMPENYIAVFDCPPEDESIQMTRDAAAQVPAVTDCIKAGKPLPPYKVGPIGKLMSGMVNDFFYKFIVKDKKFFTYDSCTGCGRCAEVCPMNNIRLEAGRPIWNGLCTHCMACITDCPTEAIEYGRASKGKRRYHCPL